MNNIFILDGQNDEILGHINKKYVIENEHERDLPTHKDYFWFTVLADNEHAEHLNKRNGLIVTGEDGELLEFRIFESIKYRDNEGLKIEVHALATYLDLKNQKIFDPHKSNPETAQQHANLALAGTEWQVGEIDFKGIRALTFDNPINSYDYILRIAREFELEPRFYIETDGQKVTSRYVDLVEQIGEFRGRTIEFGRDLQRIERKEDTSEVVTALWVYGPEKEDGTRLKVLVEDDEARQRWGRKGKHIVDYHEPETENDDITEARLRTLGETELKKRINAVVTYEAEILDLENVPGLENKKIRFGDTIRIKDIYFNPPLYVEARVFNVKRDVFNKAKKIVQLGDYVEYSEEEVKALFKQMQAEIRNRLEKLVLVTIVSSAGNVFKNGIGSTELTAKTFLSGNEVDEDGTKYEYRWYKFDKNGDYDAGFYEEGKTITVSADTIDEKASFRVEIILDDEVLTVHEITLTNVFDGADGEQGPPGEDGQPTYTWVKYADDEHGNGMSDSPEGKLYIGLAFNKTTPEESNNPADYTWSLMPQNIEIGGSNLMSLISLNDDNYMNESIGSLVSWKFQGKPNTQYTLSTNIPMRGTTVYELFFDIYPSSPSSSVNGVSDGNPRTITTDSTGLVEVTFRPSHSAYPNIQDVINGLYWVKLEKGNKATDWTRADEDVQAEIDEAKQEAEEAKQEAQNALSEAQQAQTTADGKNAVFRQSNTPPTTNRKIGDLWFDTANGNKMYVWTGSWTETKLDYQALAVGKLSAISADLGNVTAGHISGVTMDLADGKFSVDENGNVTFGGSLDGATGTFSGSIDTPLLRVGTGTISGFDSVGLRLVTAQWSETGTFPKTGEIFFNTLNDALEIYKLNNSDVEVPLQGFKVSATTSVFEGALNLHSNGEHLRMYGNNSSYIGFYTGLTRRAYVGLGSPGSYDFYIRNEASGDLRLYADSGRAILSGSTANVLVGNTMIQRGVNSADRWGFQHTSNGLEISPSGTGWSNYGTLYLNRSGAMTRVRGDFAVDGSKSAIVQTDNYGERLMYALETPDSRFVAYTEHTLTEGEHWIDIEPMFLETINENDYFVVPHVQNASDVIILERRNGKFRVWVHGHTAEVVFEVNGKRKGYENVYMEEVENLGDELDESNTN